MIANCDAIRLGADDCFAEKKERVWQLRVDRAKECGQEILGEKDAKRVFLYADEVSPQSGFVKLDDVCEADPKGRTWRKLLGKNVPIVTIARDARGYAHELVALEDAAKALKTAGRTFKVPKAPPTRDPGDYRREQEREAKARAIRAAAAREAVTLIVAKVEKRQPGKGLWRFMTEALLGSAGLPRFIGVCECAARGSSGADDVSGALSPSANPGRQRKSTKPIVVTWTRSISLSIAVRDVLEDTMSFRTPSRLDPIPSPAFRITTAQSNLAEPCRSDLNLRQNAAAVKAWWPAGSRTSAGSSSVGPSWRKPAFPTLPAALPGGASRRGAA